VSRAAGWGRAAATLAVVLVADQASKALAVARIERGEQVNVFFGLDLTNTRNRGVAFGALQGSATLVGVLIAAALVLLLAYFAFNASRPYLWLPVGLLLGGAVGNLVDRAREGAVIDFIDPTFWPAFNLADASIVIGVLALLYVVEGKRE
jgi:signal peptidase II